jgi:hypothetical protein
MRLGAGQVDRGPPGRIAKGRVGAATEERSGNVAASGQGGGVEGRAAVRPPPVGLGPRRQKPLDGGQVALGGGIVERRGRLERRRRHRRLRRAGRRFALTGTARQDGHGRQEPTFGPCGPHR